MTRQPPPAALANPAAHLRNALQLAVHRNADGLQQMVDGQQQTSPVEQYAVT